METLLPLSYKGHVSAKRGSIHTSQSDSPRDHNTRHILLEEGLEKEKEKGVE